jgi:hypothetical protein
MAVKRSPVLLQNIIQPTPHKSAALFRLYNPSVTHMSVFDFMPSTIHVRLCLVGWDSSIPSHIHLPPHVLRNSQKSVGRGGPLASEAPLLSLLTVLFVSLTTDVGAPLLKVGEISSAQISW